MKFYRPGRDPMQEILDALIQLFQLEQQQRVIDGDHMGAARYNNAVSKLMAAKAQIRT